jgi:tetratricopeptide (TPR) repeat protein
MKRAILALAALAATAVAAALAYQAVARQRDYKILLERGDAALREDQTFTAIEAYSGAVALRSDAMLGYLRRGEAYRRRGDAARGDLGAAARDLRMAAAIDPAATRPLEELGDVLYETQRYDRAADTYDRYLRLDDRSARVAYKLALARYRDRNPEVAVSALAIALRLDAKLPDAYYLLGICLRDLNRLPDAAHAFERAVALSAGMTAAREELADVYGALGRRADALEQLQLLAGLDRDHVERQVALGLAQARAGQADLAVLTLGNALERTPNQPLIYGALGRVWLDRAQAKDDRVDLSKALEALERVASNPGATSELLTLYGRALLQDGEPDVAERVLQQASSRYPLEPTALVLYAQAAERQNHLDPARQALIDYENLTDDDPELVARAKRIAALSLKLEDAETAVEWLQRASATRSTDLELLGSLADAQIRAGDLESARGSIRRALEREPANPAFVALARRVGALRTQN